MAGDASELLESLKKAVLEALQKGALTDADRPAARLAWSYADAIDRSLGTASEADVLKDLGPKYHALLNDLGLTPRGRSAKPAGGEPGDPVDPREAALRRLRIVAGAAARPH